VHDIGNEVLGMILHRAKKRALSSPWLGRLWLRKDVTSGLGRSPDLSTPHAVLLTLISLESSSCYICMWTEVHSSHISAVSIERYYDKCWKTSSCILGNCVSCIPILEPAIPSQYLWHVFNLPGPRADIMATFLLRDPYGTI